MSEKHTPGPWFYEGAERGSKYVIRYKAPHYAADARGELIAGGIERADDARLLSAAPEMLAALEHVVANHELLGSTSSLDMDGIRAAIAKARGSQP